MARAQCPQLLRMNHRRHQDLQCCNLNKKAMEQAIMILGPNVCALLRDLIETRLRQTARDTKVIQIMSSHTRKARQHRGQQPQ